MRRIAEVAALFADAGLIVLVAAVSPFERERRAARELIGEGEFTEIFVDTPLDLCRKRAVSGAFEGKKTTIGDLYDRITSYNVCYTKLLRSASPKPSASSSS